MKKPEHNLFDLVHSLGKNERRYFKLFAKNLGAKSNNYIALFDLLLKQEDYDEAKLKLKFKNKKFILHLSSNKQYLFDLILKAMRSYRTSNSVEDQLLESLRNFKFLKKKGLIKILKKEIQHAEALAIEYDHIHLLPMIFHWKNFVQAVSLENQNNAEDIEEEIRTWLNSISNLNDFTLLKTQLKRSIYFWRKSKKTIPNIVTPPPKDQIKLRIAYYDYMAIRAYQELDELASLDYRFAMVELFEELPHLLKDLDLFNVYVVTLSNAMDICSYMPLINEFQRLFKLFGNLNQARIPKTSLLFIFNCKLRFYRQTAAIELGMNTVEEFQHFLEQNKEMNTLISDPIINYELGALYFVKEDFDIALDYFNKSANILKKQKIHESLYYNLRLLEILIFYKKEEVLLIENMIRSFQRKLTNTDEFYALGNTFIKLLLQLIKHAMNKDICSTLLSEGHAEILKLKESSSAHLLFFFPYEEWIISQQKELPLKVVIQQKTQLID
jgi:tetratricopeptide (TPR) repeat protein